MPTPATTIKNNVIESLRVILETSNGDRFHGAVTEGDAEGDSARLTCEFPRSSHLELSIGDIVKLVMPSLRGLREHSEEAKVVLRLEDRLRVRYGFTVGRDVALVYSRITDWRLATRVRPFPDAPVQARIQPPGSRRSYTVDVHDISATGLGVTLSNSYEPELFSHWETAVTIQLPGSSTEFEIATNIVYRRPAGDDERIYYGLDFDAEVTEDFADKQARIYKFVVGHLNAVLYSFRHGRLNWLESQDREAASDETAPARSVEEPILDSSLELLRNTWPDLPEYVREAVLTLVRGECSKGTSG